MLFAAVDRMWYALPLIVATSLVYGATRHELARPILSHAIRFGGWLLVFMGVLYAAVWLASAWL